MLPPERRSMVRLPRFSVGTNWITTLSVTMRTASRSTSGTLRPSGLAGAVREEAAIAAIMALTKPPPEQSALRVEGSVTQLQPLKSIAPSHVVMAGLDPAVHVFLHIKQGVAARHH